MDDRCPLPARPGIGYHMRMYLDPTSGSMLLQLLLGGVAGIAVAIRLFWHRFVGFFGARKRDDDQG